MKRVSQKSMARMQKVGTLWIRYAHIVFFLLLTVVFAFAVFEWKTLVFSPKDRLEELKHDLLQAEQKKLDTKRLESALEKIENPRQDSPTPDTRRNLFASY